MSRDKELAFRYDLFISPDWRARFDNLVDQSIKLPSEGRILDVNCGTGAHAIELVERMKGKGDIVGIDPNAERVELARAKALVKKIKGVEFHQASAVSLPFESDEFDMVIGDGSLVHTEEIEDVLAEMIRVAQTDARVVLKMATRSSFNEFFSIYWEALLNAELVDEVWSELEWMINERMIVADAERMAESLGLRKVESFVSREEFQFENGSEFLEAPLVEDLFLADWLAIVPEDRRNVVLARIEEIIERERHDAPFYISIKATLIVGIK